MSSCNHLIKDCEVIRRRQVCCGGHEVQARAPIICLIHILCQQRQLLDLQPGVHLKFELSG